MRSFTPICLRSEAVRVKFICGFQVGVRQEYDFIAPVAYDADARGVYGRLEHVCRHIESNP